MTCYVKCSLFIQTRIVLAAESSRYNYSFVLVAISLSAKVPFYAACHCFHPGNGFSVLILFSICLVMLCCKDAYWMVGLCFAIIC